MIWYRPTFLFNLSVHIVVAPGFCLPEILSFTILSAKCKNNSHTFILRRDTHWQAVFSRWCCYKLGKRLQHVYTNLQLQQSKQKISEAQEQSLSHFHNYPCHQNYYFKNLDAIWHFITRRSMKQCMIKTRETEFQITEYELSESKRTAEDGKWKFC